MALKLLQAGIQPLGQFDMLDTELASITGGELVTFTSASKTVTAAETAVGDALDGYVYADNRPVITLADAQTDAPMYLADDGTSGYGTLFGGVVSMFSTGGAALGPHTALASGKVTVWDKPGLYEISLDSLDSTTTDGLHPTVAASVPGLALTVDNATGHLTPVGSTAAGGNTAVFARFMEFVDGAGHAGQSGSLVNTPNYLAGATAEYNSAVIAFRVE